MAPKDISRRVLGRPLRNPYAPDGGRRPRSKWLLLLPAAWLVWAGVASDHSLWRIARLRHELAATNADLRRVKSEAARLNARLDDPRQRAEHAEEVLRSQGMSRPGEVIYRLGGDAVDTSRAGAARR